MSIKKISLVDQVYRQLRTEIISLQYPLGSKLNVAELQERLGVSSTPIREAVNRLQQEGLIVYENNVGAHIIALDEHDVVEIQQLGLTLHQAAIRLAIQTGDRGVIMADLQRWLVKYRAATTIDDEVLAVNQFLGVYYFNCGNLRLSNSMLSIQGQQLLLRYLFADCVPARAADSAVFAEMVRATEAGDEEMVCATLRQYTDKMSEVLVKRLKSSDR